MKTTNDWPATEGAEAAGAPRTAGTIAVFGLAYYTLAAYAAALPAQAQFPLPIWPADGLLLGALLVAPLARWMHFAGLAFLATLVLAMRAGVAPELSAMAAIVNAVGPALVAAGLLRLSGGRLRIGTLPGMTAFLVNLVPLLTVVSLLEAGASWIGYGQDFRAQWTSVLVSDFLSAIVVAPLVLVWSRGGWKEAAEPIRGRVAEAVVLFAGLVFATNFVFRMPAEPGGFVAPLAHVCSPFLIWAALRFGLRAATLGIAAFGLICYWHTAQGLGPFAIVSGDWRALLFVQGYLATVVVTTLFAAALLAEREAAAQTTEAWRRRHEAAILASGNLLYELDPASGRILWAGDTRAVLGIAAEGIANVRQWMERVHPDDRPRLRGIRQRLITGEIPHIATEYRVKRNEGEWITVGVNGYAIDDPTRHRGGQRRIIGFVSDISERVRAEAERQALATQLKQAEKMEAVGRLAGGIAHDFNNILGAILGYGELAQARAQADPQLKRYVDTIVSAGNRAKSLVEQILSYSRAEGGVQSPVVLAPVAAEACDLLRGSAPAGIEVRLATPEQDVVVMGDPTRLHQLFMNLSSNAIQAMPEGGVLEVVISTRTLAATVHTRLAEVPPGEYVVLEVKDAGEGIEPAVIDRIFEPFFTTKRAGRGTGLGLALVHSIVREHGGAIDVTSEVGHGTTFTVWLPRLEHAGTAPAAEQAGDAGRGQVVLAVDDEPEVLAALEEMLATLGYEPAGYTDSRAALDAFRADPGRFDAVISDERMPELDGTHLAVALREAKPGIPIVIATGFGGEGFEARALAAGVNRVVRKPYRMQDIGDALGAALGAASPPE